jgi:sugar phosphate isomerase/epimerase
VNRRDFLRHSAALTAGAGLAGLAVRPASALVAAPPAADPLFPISLAEWSLHKALFAKQMDHLDFAATAARHGFQGAEYVNQFFKDRAKDRAYLAEMKKRADDAGIRSVLIMCDGEGNLGDPDAAKRAQAVENHHKWADAAAFLGCHSIRVNAHSEGSPEEQRKLCADGLHRLAEYTEKQGIHTIVENHGGLSSYGEWLVGTLKAAGPPQVGTLPDFGNFGQAEGGGGLPANDSRYEGVAAMMPLARGVSAKSYDFGPDGEETKIDYHRMMKIVLDAGYRGFVGVEYEGERMSEEEGLLATKRLLERVREQLAPNYA